MEWWTIVRNVVLGMVPDILIAWGYAHYMDGGWPEFWTAIVALQALYFALWLKRALWVWPLFWLFSRRSMAKTMETFLRDNYFPRPEMWVGDFDDYLQQIEMDQDIDPKTKIKAAFEHGTLNGLKASRNYMMIMMTNSAGKLALNRYTRYAPERYEPSLQD
jgi:hypothetical protein